MVIGIKPGTISEEEVRTRFSRNSRLNPSDRLGDGPELQGAHAGRSQEGSEHHVVPGRHADDVVQAGVDSLHEAAPGPPGPDHHHPGLLVWLRRAQPGGPAGLRLRGDESSDRVC